MLNQFRTQYLETAAENLKQWLTFHNLPRWSVPVGWAVAVVPAIAVAHYDIPLPTVLLLNVSGFVGLLWLIQESSADDCDQPSENADNFDLSREWLKQEIDSQSNGSLEEPEPEVSEENLQNDLDEVDSDASSLDETVSIADEENNQHFAEEDRFAVVSTYRD